MIHEFIEIIQSYKTAQQNNVRSVMATVVDLDGSSYRKPGVRMLIHENGQMTGAVSGGCVENEILKQSYSVFKTGIPKIITYDGRYRLGCEGVLYILIELFDPLSEMLIAFEKSIEERKNIVIESFYKKEVSNNSHFGSEITIGGMESFSFSRSNKININSRIELNIFRQDLGPLFRMVIIGAEHDAVHLCKQANTLGWEVIIIAGVSDPIGLDRFPGAKNLFHQAADSFDTSIIDEHTAIVLMTHNYARDLQFLTKLNVTNSLYLGLLGSKSRRDRLLDEFTERKPEVKDSFLDRIYAPTGLNIGAVTPQEIALSVCAEILSVIRKGRPVSIQIPAINNA